MLQISDLSTGLFEQEIKKCNIPFVRVWERFRWILKKKVKEEIVFILYSVQHMSYLYHKHHIFNIFVYNSMSTFSLRSCALKICSPIMSLFLLFLFKFWLRGFLHCRAPSKLVPKDTLIILQDFSFTNNTSLSPTAPFSKSLSSPRLHFHQQHLC